MISLEKNTKQYLRVYESRIRNLDPTRHSKVKKLWGTIFTHLWSEKVILRKDRFKEVDYCKNMISTIRSLDFDGKIYDKVKTIPQLYKFTEFFY